MPQGLVKPSRGILYAGDPLIMEYEVLTATTMYPGRLVITDTNEWDIKVATTGASTVLGVLDVEPNELRTTLYGAGDQARVLSGDIVVLLTSAQLGDTAIAIGTKLQAGASGTVYPGSTAGKVIGYSLQALAAGAASTTILVKLTI